MTSQQILERAIQKAIDGGWKPHRGIDADNLRFTATPTRVRFSYTEADKDLTQPIAEWSAYGVIFNHDFAKALWGNEMIECYHAKDVKCRMTAWAYHLQNMVISDDPIKYLGDNMDA